MRALDDFGKAAEQVPGPSQVGATAPETPYSNSPTQPLPQCCRNARSHSQELRAAAQVTGALFTPPSHTRDACWDVLISCRIALRAGTTWQRRTSHYGSGSGTLGVARNPVSPAIPAVMRNPRVSGKGLIDKAAPPGNDQTRGSAARLYLSTLMLL